MIIVFPIGGKGQRFVQAGFKDPKPFVDVGGERMIDKVFKSYPVPSWVTSHVYVIRKEYEPDFPFGAHVIKKDTRGPVETIMSVTDVVVKINKHNEDLLIADCDSIINQEELIAGIKAFKKDNADGGTFVRQSNNPAYSYARLDKMNYILETREKDPFTPWTTTGPYWFKSGKEFIRAATHAMGDNVYSVSPLYNYLIKTGLRIKAVPTETFCHLGTPGELNEFCNNRGINVQPSRPA